MMIPPNPSFTEALTSETRQAFYEQHKPIAHMMHLILVVLPLAGIVVRGMVGAVLGLTVFLLCYYLMPYAWFALHGSSRV
ncbi:MAG: hypothetical protein HY348_10885 [Nitrospira defluvii]|nr:hypothetical protein [Nitrospira defluvii]